MSRATWFQRATILFVVTMISVASGNSASAVVPEIVLDPRTAKGESRNLISKPHWLRLSVAQFLSSHKGEVSWRRAPWHAN